MAEQIGMGSVYRPETGTGIAWQPGQAQLWMGGKVIAQAAHDTPSPWAFWHGLHFGTAFPMITHWGFRSVWTGRVKIGPTQKTPIDDRGTFWGWVTFDLLDAPRRTWGILDTNPVGVETPYPPNEEQPANLPLRLVLAHLIVARFRDEIPPDTWMAVTSLVASDQLARVFSRTHQEAATTYGSAWRLAMGDSLMAAPLRDALCIGLGLTQPVAA
ncbi:hypothetical protein EKD04_018010 [Chloroflexales bacterium ZM16-3]|nr:hypothetical protein [Chloroflexales bacterium ZM16-3]